MEKNNMFKPLDSLLNKIFNANYVKHARMLLLLFLLIMLLPVILTQVPFSLFDFTETGQIGDTIGGITAPFIGVIAGYLTFLAFHEQYRANNEAKNDLAKERFESKFYNFLTLLNNLEINTHIPNVGNYKQAFHFMFYEFKAIAVLIYRKQGKPTLEIVKTKEQDFFDIREDSVGIVKNVREEILKEAFNIFINGVSKSATSRMKEYIDGSETMNDYFLELQYLYSKPENPSVPYLDDYKTVNIKLFDGHRLRVISFFRLVCKIIELIYKDGGNEKEKETYLSTLLSILSEHQIALLKLLYIYDKDQNFRFVMDNNGDVASFFTEQYNRESDDKKVCISKYIFSNTLDCTKDDFINFNSKVGELPMKEKGNE